MSATGDFLRQAGRATDAQEGTQRSLVAQPSRGAPGGPAEALASLTQSQVSVLAAARAAVQASADQSAGAIQAMSAAAVSMAEMMLEIAMKPIVIEYDQDGDIKSVRRV